MENIWKVIGVGSLPKLQIEEISKWLEVNKTCSTIENNEVQREVINQIFEF